MYEKKLESLNYDVLSNIRSFLPSEDKNKVFLLNKELNATFTYDVIKEKSKKLNTDLKKLVLLLTESLKTKFSDKEKLNEINNILQNFFEFLDSDTLKNISAEFQSLYDKVKSQITNPEINYCHLFKPVLEKFNNDEAKEIENLCQKLDQSENKAEEDVVNLLYKLKKMEFIKLLDVNYAEIQWYLAILQVKRNLEAKNVNFKETSDVLKFIDSEFLISSPLSKNVLKENFNKGFFDQTSNCWNVGFNSIFSFIISVLIIPTLTIIALHTLPPLWIIGAAFVCSFFIFQIIQQTCGLIKMINADKNREETREEANLLKEEIKGNLCTFFKASNSDKNGKFSHSDEPPSLDENDIEMPLLIINH